MSDADRESIPTRPSLLARLANWEDQQSWEEFRRLYSGLIRRTALRAGLTEAEADDIEQETLLRVVPPAWSVGVPGGPGSGDQLDDGVSGQDSPRSRTQAGS